MADIEVQRQCLKVSRLEVDCGEEESGHACQSYKESESSMENEISLEKNDFAGTP